MKRWWSMWMVVALAAALTACGADESTPAACADGDGDGFWTGADCAEGQTQVDCDDSNSTVHPGATEICGNGIDEDCSGSDLSCDVQCEDQDGDGYGQGSTCKGIDCDDTNPAVHPGATEVCGNGIDEDCAGGDATCRGACLDEDQDGFGVGTGCTGPVDCDDNDAARHPNAQEVCGNGKDEDCNGQDLTCPSNCQDADGDGYGQGLDCVGIDCDDGDAGVHPGAQEICGNGKDDDCMLGDETCPVQCLDADMDGFGEGPDCQGPDCNDYDFTVNPNAQETCGDGVDQDCDGSDLACPDECVDSDGDEFGVGGACEVVDCDDTNPAAYPGADEVCGDDIDQDCNGSDLPCEQPCVDNDGDGYGEGDTCAGADCNDDDPDVNPGAAEVCGNGKDDDCAGGDEDCPTDCVDKDSDGYGVGADCEGNPDCDDLDAGVNPGAAEICENGTDENCDEVDDECPAQPCEADAECETGQICDLASGECRYAKVWEWWAPAVYVDTDTDHAGHDLLCPIDFDGDQVILNNGEHKDDPDKAGVVYYSFVKTQTHWYLGYFFYHPWRYSPNFGSLGTQYENSMKGLLLVVEQDGSTYGKLVLMETLAEDSFFQYVPTVSDLSGGSSVDGTIRFDASGHHPIVYVHQGDHAVFGDTYTWNNVSNWEVGGFPGGDGVVYRWGNVAEVPGSDNDQDVKYELRAVNDHLWPLRFETSGTTQPFDEFGHWTSNEYNARSLAPWRFYDANASSRPHGEAFFNPADFVKNHFQYGWGAFSHEYVYNPYALRVDIDDLFVVDADGNPFGGDVDPYFILYMRDGSGKEYKALDIFYGLQNNWHAVDVNPGLYPLDMHDELGRFYFYGIDHPDHEYFGVAVKDDDGGITAADWLMSSEQTEYYSYSGQQLLDWTMSNAYITVHVQ